MLFKNSALTTDVSWRQMRWKEDSEYWVLLGKDLKGGRKKYLRDYLYGTYRIYTFTYIPVGAKYDVLHKCVKINGFQKLEWNSQNVFFYSVPTYV